MRLRPRDGAELERRRTAHQRDQFAAPRRGRPLARRREMAPCAEYGEMKTSPTPIERRRPVLEARHQIPPTKKKRFQSHNGSSRLVYGLIACRGL